MKTLLILSVAAFVMAGYAAEKLFTLQKTPEALKIYDRYGQNVTEIVKLEDDSKIHFKKGGVLWIPLEYEKFSGKSVKIRMVYKTSGVPNVPPGANPGSSGFKASLCASTKDKKYWGFQIGPFRGDNDWRGAVRIMDKPVPNGLTSFRLQIDSTGGEVWIDEIVMEEGK